METTEDSKDRIINRLLLKNEKLRVDLEGISQENDRYEKYVRETIWKERGGGMVTAKLNEINQHCLKTGLVVNQLPLILKQEYSTLMEKRDEIEKEIEKVLFSIKGFSAERWGMKEANVDHDGTIVDC